MFKATIDWVLQPCVDEEQGSRLAGILLYRANIPDCSAVEGFDVNNFHKDKV